MRKVTLVIASFVAWMGGAAQSAYAVELDSKAEKITFTGRLHAGWWTSTIEGDPSNEFLIRRARLAMRVQINDWIHAMVEPDFAPGSAIDLKDAYVRFTPHDNFDFTLGQTKRRFDLFELTSSTQMLVAERDGRIGRVKVPSYSQLTETLLFADRDVGVFASGHTDDDRVRIEAAVTQGVAANTRPTLGAKAFQVRGSFEPLRDRDLALHAGVSVRPYRAIATPPAAPVDTSTAYASAFEVSGEWGNYTSGLHIQAGFVTGDNLTTYDPVADEDQTFNAFQVIGAYKWRLAEKRWFEAFEPIFRFSLADPNTDVDDDGGTLFTPGINLYMLTRTRLTANADIFVPEEDDIEGNDAIEDTEVSFKLMTFFYF